MDWLDKLSAKKGIVGIEILSDGLAIAAKGCLSKADDIDLLHVINTDQASEAKVDLGEELSLFVDKNKISNRRCHLVLSPKDYQLLLVEAPEVPDEDLREAMRWRIKDLISIPVEQAVIDVFKLPADASRSAKKMLYVVVAELARVEQLISMVNDSGLTLASIDIVEMSMRNISIVVDSALKERGVGIVRLHEGGGVVSLYREGNLYLSRQFKLSYGGGLLDELPVDSLALEIQRSLDYYERQMGVSPPAALFIGGENIMEDKITQELVRSINVPAQFLDVSQSITLPEEMDDGLVQLCLGALGGAYRETVLQ